VRQWRTNHRTEEFIGMPDAAVATGVVDFVLPLDEISSMVTGLVTGHTSWPRTAMASSAGVHGGRRGDARHGQRRPHRVRPATHPGHGGHVRPVAQAAHDLEFVLGEGSATVAITSGALVVAAGPAVRAAAGPSTAPPLPNSACVRWRRRR
jgi:hypothetical protein